MKYVIRFANDEHTRQQVYEYFTQEIEKIALQKVFAQEDVSVIPQAKQLLDQVFSSLDKLGKKEPKALDDPR
jgi:hypothetical protein